MVFFIVMALCCFLLIHFHVPPEYDVRRHFSTVTGYDAAKEILLVDKNTSFLAANVPDGCSPIQLNLVARNGICSPTEKQMRELERWGAHLQELIRDAEGQGLSLDKVPDWMLHWKSPWKGKMNGGDLVKYGQRELHELGRRIRKKFPDLFVETYHPDVYPIKATQDPRASASAMAFGMGLFNENDRFDRRQAFVITTESPGNDTMVFSKNQEPAIKKLKEPVLEKITCALASRFGLNFTRQDTATLWFLCEHEASVLRITNRACALFSRSEVSLLEWADDMELFILKGYGNSINRLMGVPLLEDIVQSMEKAIKAKEDKHAPRSYEKARIRFATAEIVVPYTCLLGLFLEGSAELQKEEPLELPPKPPQGRKWRGSLVAPSAGNNMLVLHSCPANSASKYFVQVLHNEHPIRIPGCYGSDFCPFEEFKKKIVAPH